jgi:hypothetical protein
VAGDSGEAVVAAAQLEVGVADSGKDDAYEGEAGPGDGPAHVADVCPAGREEERLHGRGVWHRDEKAKETVA